MKKFFLLLVTAFGLATAIQAQAAKEPASPQFMQITTVESVLSGGSGRSKMIITNPDGTQKETELENLFSLVGINFKNIKKNENDVIRILKEYTSSGWVIDHVTSLTLSPNDIGSGGIFMTRYLLSKPVLGN